MKEGAVVLVAPAALVSLFSEVGPLRTREEARVALTPELAPLHAGEAGGATRRLSPTRRARQATPRAGGAPAPSRSVANQLRRQDGDLSAQPAHVSQSGEIMGVAGR